MSVPERVKTHSKEFVLDAGRRGIRSFGMLTAQVRPGPDFLVIGAKRGGSTSFYFDLITHPQIGLLFPRPDHLPKATATKGVHYFDSNYQRSPRWYASHFPTTRVRSRQSASTGRPTVVGEASPFYLSHPAAAERAATCLPDAKLIALLRDPVERTHSHWKERRREGVEPLDFESALRAEKDRIGGDMARLTVDPAFYSYAAEHQGYLTQSQYGRCLQAWLDHFPRSSLCVLRSEDFYADPNRELNRVAAFLGISPHTFSVGPARNAAPGGEMSASVRRELESELRADATLVADLVGVTWSWV